MIGYDAAVGWLSIGTRCMLPLLLIIRTAQARASEVIGIHAD